MNASSQEKKASRWGYRLLGVVCVAGLHAFLSMMAIIKFEELERDVSPFWNWPSGILAFPVLFFARGLATENAAFFLLLGLNSVLWGILLTILGVLALRWHGRY